jgi:parallel beta-helix repeat protein
MPAEASIHLLLWWFVSQIAKGALMGFKIWLGIAGVAFLASAQAATTFYVDADNGADSNAGTEIAAAWKTIAKVNASQHLIHPGDSVLLRAGQIFNGPLMLSTSGTEGMPITYGRYGEGAKPEITGFALANNWKLIQKGIWEASCPNASSTLNVVTIDGKMFAKGRYPNLDAPNGGYLTVESHVDNTSLTDSKLPATPNWTGAEVVIRKARYIIDRNLITSHKGNTLTCKSGSTYHIMDKHGYFIQNDPRTLDAYGEWYFNPEQKTLRIFLGDSDPSKLSVRFSAITNVISAENRQEIHFNGLKVTGANHIAFSLNGSTRIQIRDCDVRWSGIFAIQGGGVKQFVLEDSTIADTNSNAIGFHDETTNCQIRRVAINNTGIFPGMGLSGDGTYNAISMVAGSDNLIESFTITNTGYIPVHFGGSRITIRNGLIDGFAMVKDDSGGIYAWTGNTDNAASTDRKILGNIILNSKGAPAGAVGETKGFGIYLDDATSNVEVSGNTVAHTSAGIFLHNAHHCQLTRNTFFDNDVQMLISHDDLVPGPKGEIREILCSQNTMISATFRQPVVFAESTTDDFAQFGKFEGNIYARPPDQGLIIHHTVKDARTRAYDLESCVAMTGLEKGTQPSVIKVAPYAIDRLGPNVIGNGDFTNSLPATTHYSKAGNSLIRWADGKLDGRTLEHGYKNASGTTNPSLLTLNAGPIDAGKCYLLRFSILGAADHGSIGARLREQDAPWGAITDDRFVKVDTQRRECELLLRANATRAASAIEWGFNERDGNFWLDNVALHEASVKEFDPQAFRLEFNSTLLPREIDLTGEWSDVLGATYSGKLTLPPRKSIVLIRKDACTSK